MAAVCSKPGSSPRDWNFTSDCGAEGQARFETLMDRLIAAVKVRALEEGASGARWADLWSRLSELPDRTAAINLDRGDVLAGALADLQRVKAAGG